MKQITLFILLFKILILIIGFVFLFFDYQVNFNKTFGILK